MWKRTSILSSKAQWSSTMKYINTVVPVMCHQIFIATIFISITMFNCIHMHISPSILVTHKEAKISWIKKFSYKKYEITSYWKMNVLPAYTQNILWEIRSQNEQATYLYLWLSHLLSLSLSLAGLLSWQ